MTRAQRRRLRLQPANRRQGVILLIVISLLVLFALVGIAFVIYAESQANIARIWREGKTNFQTELYPVVRTTALNNFVCIRDAASGKISGD